MLDSCLQTFIVPMFSHILSSCSWPPLAFVLVFVSKVTPLWQSFRLWKTAVRCTLCLLFSKSFLLYHLLQAQEHFEQSYPQGQPGGCLALVAAIVQFCCPLRCPGPSLQSHHFINGCPCLSCLKTFTNRPAKVVSALFLEGPYGCL